MPPNELDAMILSVFQKDYWQKTAYVIAHVLHECENRKLPVSDTEIFDRVLRLVNSGVLESAGELSRWRQSEVRPVRRPEGGLAADRDSAGEERGRIRELDRWIGQLRVSLVRKEIPIEGALARVQAQMQSANARDDQLTLALALKQLLTEAERYDEALRLIDSVIEQAPDNVRFPISKATLYFHRLDDPEKALQAIDFAIEQASRTGSFRREALNYKARILLSLGRGKELGQVLEQIMALKVPRDTPDTVRQRDFVDDAPSGLIPEDIVARYNKFCPKPVGDLNSSSEPPKWSPLDEEIWLRADPQGDIIVPADRERARAQMDRQWQIVQWVHQLRKEMPVDEMIDRVRLRMQEADDAVLRFLESELESLFTQARRYDEALQLIDSRIRQKPNDVRAHISKALLSTGIDPGGHRCPLRQVFSEG
jgi:tetratricopeptide (TPR) repeat protein